MANEDGFSLLEAIVSIAIIGLVSTALFDLVIGSGMRRAGEVQRLERLLTAQQLLSQLQEAPALPIGERPAQEGTGDNWTIRVTDSRESAFLRQVEIIPPGGHDAILTSLVRVRTR